MRVTLLVVSIATIAFGQARIAVPAGPPPGRRAIWVLQANNRLARYDAAEYKLWQELPVPPESRNKPESVCISRSGVVLVPTPSNGEITVQHWWSSNPYRPALAGGAWERRPISTGHYQILSATPSLYFSNDGQRLFWFEHREQKLATDGVDVSRQAQFLAWTTDLSGDKAKLLAEFAFPTCKCETGVCSESCPEATVWAPPSGVDDYFLVTKWIPGQVGSDFQETLVYRRTGAAWTPQKLPNPVERFLDVADHGSAYLELAGDDGCCGSQSITQLTVTRNGQTDVLFEDHKRFGVQNYDVSFAAAQAAFSPGVDQVAYTISSQPPGQDLQLAEGGKENSEELARLRKVLATMPTVEVVSLASPKQVAISIAHAEMVGWLDNSHLLIVTGGEVRLVDVASGKQTPTGIKADAAKYVFLQ